MSTQQKKMAKKLQKSLSYFVSKINKQAPHLHISPSSISSATSRILSGCKHPKSLSFTIDHSRRPRGHHHHRSNDEDDHGINKDHHHDDMTNNAATLADIDKFLHENFRSLYLKDGDADAHEDARLGIINNKYDYDDGFEEDDNKDPATRGNYKIPLEYSPRFYGAMAQDQSVSHRFFLSSTSSGSLVEEGRPCPDVEAFTSTSDDVRTSSTATSNTDVSLPGDDCIALLTASPNPYEDFKRSMAEIIEARSRDHEVAVDWEFIEELLFCYLRLNEKKHYRHILAAFVDLVTVLRQEAGEENSTQGNV